MKIAILGASGKTGLHVVEQAIKAGHEVVALVRTPSKLSIQHARLTVLQGDAMRYEDVARAINGVSAVINALGHVKGSPENLQVTVIQHVLKAMQAYGVRRLITLTGAGVRDPQDKPKLMDNVFGFLLKVMAGKVLEDSIAYVKLVQQSNTDWTVVRAPRLTDDAPTGKPQAGYVGAESRSSLSRADLAQFMLEELESSAYLHKSPAVWG